MRFPVTAQQIDLFVRGRLKGNRFAVQNLEQELIVNNHSLSFGVDERNGKSYLVTRCATTDPQIANATYGWASTLLALGKDSKRLVRAGSEDVSRAQDFLSKGCIEKYTCLPHEGKDALRGMPLPASFSIYHSAKMREGSKVMDYLDSFWILGIQPLLVLVRGG